MLEIWEKVVILFAMVDVGIQNEIDRSVGHEGAQVWL